MLRSFYGASLLALALAGQDPRPQEPRFGDRVDVERVLLDVRVVDSFGQPVRGLGREDFRVEVDGRAVTVESAQWIEGHQPYSQGLAPQAAADARAAPAPEGRLIVFFFQKDLESSRVGGLLRMQREAVKVARGLEPQDRVAVASFDSHLKLWLDFTRNREALEHALMRSIMFESRPRPTLEPHPSLLAHFDPEEGRRAANAETGLLLLGRALGELPGAKSLVLFGWGLGSMQGRFGVRPEREYGPAVEALYAARTTVFALDVTEADYHSLEVGLEKVAEDTGGFYAKTHDFPAQAMNRLTGALSGHYVIAFERPDVRPGAHPLRVHLLHGKGEVLARSTYLAPR
jgi:VWFA-related protein